MKKTTLLAYPSYNGRYTVHYEGREIYGAETCSYAMQVGRDPIVDAIQSLFELRSTEGWEAAQKNHPEGVHVKQYANDGKTLVREYDLALSQIDPITTSRDDQRVRFGYISAESRTGPTKECWHAQR